ncbi:MAG: host-nuclease inhibitor Gam family protein [Patescibacteria group bacterium]
MAKKKAEKKPTIPELQDNHEFTRALSLLCAELRNIEAIESKREEVITALMVKTELDIERIAQQAEQNARSLAAYAKMHRDEILPADRKSVDLAIAMVGFRTNPPSVKIKGTSEEAITELKEAGLRRFIRPAAEEINKERILQEPEAVAGLEHVSVSKGSEYFFVRPSETTSELRLGGGKTKRVKVDKKGQVTAS